MVKGAAVEIEWVMEILFEKEGLLQLHLETPGPPELISATAKKVERWVKNWPGS